MDGTFLFTSESVGEGHPDKLCDIISDTLLDAFLTVDPLSRVAIEAACKTGMILVFGEVTSKGRVDISTMVRECLKRVGWTAENGLDPDGCNVLVAVEHQSEDIAYGLVHGHLGASKDIPNADARGSKVADSTIEPQSIHTNIESIGAGDQGSMFGYATDETPELMPLTAVLAHKLVQRLAEARRSGELPWLRPDCKAQVTVEYDIDHHSDHPLIRSTAAGQFTTCSNIGALRPKRVHTVVLSAQHDPGISLTEMRSALLKHVVQRVIDPNLLDSQTILHIQPSGRFVIGGPRGDAGLTGRKIIVDTYGGWGAHGGGAFSGKDWSKVDRSGAYAARWIAKSLVANGLCRRCLIQVSYAIGISEPLAIYVDTYGTGRLPNSRILQIIASNFDLRPGVIVSQLGLYRPIFTRTACYGHFGWAEYPWEQVKKLEWRE